MKLPKGFAAGLGRLWARRRLKHIADPCPSATLSALLAQAKHTRYGREYGFADILSSGDVVKAFKQLPIIDYDDWVRWLGPHSPLEGGARPLLNMAWPGTIDYFCLSSGTSSGRTKYVPYSRQMAAINRKAALDMLAYMIDHDPSATPLVGRSFYMTGSTNIATNEHGCLCGDMSGITKYLAPKVLERISLPPRAVSNMEPWSKRLEALVEVCLQQRNISSISGIPIWQLTLLEALAQKEDLAQVFPDLRFLIHGGMSITPYRDRLRRLLGDQVCFMEIYAASETGITAFTPPGEEGMRFWENYEVFYEFEDEEGRVFNSGEVAPGRAYSLLVSSCSGLWRYRIGDKLVFKRTRPLVLDYVTRDKTMSAFDEKVTEKELEQAMAAMSPRFADFSVGPHIEGRRHIWFLIGETLPEGDWVAGLDDNLRRDNEDYDDYRGDGRINPPKALVIPARNQFLSCLGRIEGGQRKFPRLLSGDEVRRLLEHFS